MSQSARIDSDPKQVQLELFTSTHRRSLCEKLEYLIRQQERVQSHNRELNDTVRKSPAMTSGVTVYYEIIAKNVTTIRQYQTLIEDTKIRIGAAP